MASHIDMSKSARSTHFPRVAVIGAGPAGCTLARLLTQANVSVTIFEGEASLSDRSQGGTLDLHEKTGLAALRQCGLWDQFQHRARVDGDALRVSDKHGRTWLRIPSSGTGPLRWFRDSRPEIDRVALRELLIESLPKETIKWGRRLKNLELSSKDPRESTLTFNDDSHEADFDLIVGAEGTWSKVRNALTDEKPRYSGISGFDGTITNTKHLAPAVHSAINNGSWFNYSDGKFVSGQQTGNGSICIGVYRVQSEDWQRTTSLDVHDGAAVLNTLATDWCRDWHPTVHAMLKAIDPMTITPRNIYVLPTGFSWPNRRGVTLIGDAAHVITPFTGEGVNAAMADASDLANSIIEASRSANTDSLCSAVEAFERRMHDRMKRVQECTEQAVKLVYFTPGAPASVIEKWIVTVAGIESDGLELKATSVLVHVVYFFYRLVLRLFSGTVRA